jgi:hypothetical protein
VLLDQIGQMQRASEARGACADDQDVCFELFALDGHVFLSGAFEIRRALYPTTGESCQKRAANFLPAMNGYCHGPAITVVLSFVASFFSF